jgi:amino acid transporter
VEAATVVVPGDGHPVMEVEDKGLKKGLGFFSTLVIGINSTAPAYSLAAVLSGIVVAVGLQAPASLIVSFVPMFFIAASFYYMNRADPDCGTTFTWVTNALGPWSGWIAGWAVCMTGVLVIGSLADVAALYTFSILGMDSAAASIGAVTALAVAYIAITTAICVIGTEISANVQVVLGAIQILGLVLLAVVAIAKVAFGDVSTAPVMIGEESIVMQPPGFSLDWFFPWEIGSTTGLTAGLLIGVFIYWGWESSLTLNEENEDADASGRAGIVATVLLVVLYVLIAAALLAYAGLPAFESADEQGIESVLFDDLAGSILGDPLAKIVILAVLTSALASTQTTILPASRTSLSMARQAALPKAFGEVSPRWFTPVFSTIAVGVLAVAWYVPLNLIAQGTLFDSLQALSLLIAFYYAINGVACFIFYRREILRPGPWISLAIGLLCAGGALLTLGGVGDYYDWASAFGALTWIGVALLVALLVVLLVGRTTLKASAYLGIAPLVGAVLLGYVLVRSVLDLADPANSSSGDTWLGVTPALVMGLGFLAVGVIIMVATRLLRPKPFFDRPRLVVPHEVAREAPVERQGESS